MKIYKFGGASVQSAEGIRNIAKIVSNESDNLFVVVSAMGKTTNAMEEVLSYFMKGNRVVARQKLSEIEDYHRVVVWDLFPDRSEAETILARIFKEPKEYVQHAVGDDYDRCYDHLVSFGEIFSTSIISAYLSKVGVKNSWLDMRKLLITDSNFREANVRMDESKEKLMQAVDFKKNRIYIGQGFIGANAGGAPTTLGREGSDYSAAVVGNLLDAESVTIWKDVPGILNADPRVFDDTVLIPELSYLDAVELAHSGAKVIHPKTIKPLENKEIPLYVRPFSKPEEAGSVIKSKTSTQINVPILILLEKQVLVTIRPRDFSFVLEESLLKIFNTINKYRLKVSLIQSSAISVSVAVDDSRYLARALDELSADFKLSYNEGVELLTIRGINPELQEKVTKGRSILLSQRTRRIGRFLLKKEEGK